MGYVNNSPVKQIWLPLEYDFVDGHNSESFKDVAIDYKERYGIDLYDVFGLYKIGDSDYLVYTKYDLTGAYVVGGYYGVTPCKMAKPDAVTGLLYSGRQDSQPKPLVAISVGDYWGDSGFGFQISLPPASTQISSIDDLLIQKYEI